MICRREKKKKKSREQESERARKRYAEDPEYRARKLAANRAYQRKNRQQIAARQRENFLSRRQKDRKRYAEDADYRARTLAKNLAYYRSRREELIARRRERWWSDPEFRARQVARFREKRHMLIYGLTAEDYQRLLVAQNGACAVWAAAGRGSTARRAARYERVCTTTAKREAEDRGDPAAGGHPSPAYPSPREGQRPLAIKKNKRRISGSVATANSPAPRPVKRAAAGGSA